jgi:hypothetical protein
MNRRRRYARSVALSTRRIELSGRLPRQFVPKCTNGDRLRLSGLPGPNGAQFGNVTCLYRLPGTTRACESRECEEGAGWLPKVGGRRDQPWTVVRGRLILQTRPGP